MMRQYKCIEIMAEIECLTLGKVYDIDITNEHMTYTDDEGDVRTWGEECITQFKLVE